MLKLLGPHCIRSTPEALAWSRVAPVVKALDTVEPLRIAREDALRIFRHYFPTQDWSRSAESIVGEILNALGGYRHPRLLAEVAFNEVREADWPKLQRIVEIMEDAGIACCGPCWATGTYEAQDWFIARAHNWGSLASINVHGYWGDQGFWEVRPDGTKISWHALRFTQFWNPVDPPLLITECGRDAIEGGKGGWLKDGISAEQYVAELKAYDAELVKLPYVLGATVYTAGAYQDNNPSQTPYNVDSIIPLLLEQEGSQPLPAQPGDILEDDGGNTMSDNHSVYDAFMKSLGGPGSNSATALGGLRESHPELGVMIGGEQDFKGGAGTFRIQFYAGGIAWAEVDRWEHQGIARTEAELPFR